MTVQPCAANTHQQKHGKQTGTHVNKRAKWQNLSTVYHGYSLVVKNYKRWLKHCTHIRTTPFNSVKYFRVRGRYEGDIHVFHEPNVARCIRGGASNFPMGADSSNQGG